MDELLAQVARLQEDAERKETADTAAGEVAQADLGDFFPAEEPVPEPSVASEPRLTLSRKDVIEASRELDLPYEQLLDATTGLDVEFTD